MVRTDKAGNSLYKKDDPYRPVWGGGGKPPL